MSDIKTENMWLMKCDCLERSRYGVKTDALDVRTRQAARS